MFSLVHFKTSFKWVCKFVNENSAYHVNDVTVDMNAPEMWVCYVNYRYMRNNLRVRLLLVKRSTYDLVNVGDLPIDGALDDEV